MGGGGLGSSECEATRGLDIVRLSVANVVCLFCFFLGAHRDVMDAEGRPTRGGAGASIADARGPLLAHGNGEQPASVRRKVGSPSGGSGQVPSPASPSISDILKYGAVQYLYQRASPDSEAPAAGDDGSARGGVGDGRGSLMLRDEKGTPRLASAFALEAAAPPAERDIALEESADAGGASSGKGVPRAIAPVFERDEDARAVGDAGAQGQEEASRFMEREGGRSVDEESAASAASATPGPDKKAEREEETGAATGGWKSCQRQEEERKTRDAAEERLQHLRKAERDRIYAEECAILEAQWTRSTGSMSSSWRDSRRSATSPRALGIPPVQVGPLLRSQSTSKMPEAAAYRLEMTPRSRAGSVHSLQHSLERASSMPFGRLAFTLCGVRSLSSASSSSFTRPPPPAPGASLPGREALAAAG